MEQRSRRVGTFTLGFTLIAFGIAFIGKIICSPVSYSVIFRFWPLILIVLGFEVLVSYIRNREDQYKYDGFSILIIIGMSFFSMGMACCEMIINHIELFVH